MERRESNRSLAESMLVHLDLQYGERAWRLAIQSLKDSVRAFWFLLYIFLLVNGFSVVQDFEPIPHLIEHALTKVMGCNASDHPVLITEPSWNTQANRERMAEIMFEEFNVPAFYIANTGVLNAYVIDTGLLARALAYLVFISTGLRLVKALLWS
jgi:hypothetical protein